MSSPNLKSVPPSAPANHDGLLKSGGGGGNFDPMEQRVKHLEDDMREVRADLKLLARDVSEIKGRISMLPGYGGIALVVGLIVGLSTAAQIVAKLLP